MRIAKHRLLFLFLSLSSYLSLERFGKIEGKEIQEEVTNGIDEKIAIKEESQDPRESDSRELYYKNGGNGNGNSNSNGRYYGGRQRGYYRRYYRGYYRPARYYGYNGGNNSTDDATNDTYYNNANDGADDDDIIGSLTDTTLYENQWTVGQWTLVSFLAVASIALLVRCSSICCRYYGSDHTEKKYEVDDDYHSVDSTVRSSVATKESKSAEWDDV